jgi:hypothetical protein
MKTMIILVFSVLLLALCVPASASAQDGTPVWTNTFNVPSFNPIGYIDNPIALDAGGNVYAIAYLNTIKYSPAGVMLWSRPFNALGNGTNMLANSLAVDVNSNVIVIGWPFGSGIDYGTIKYSTAGVALWTNLYNGPGNANDEPIAIAVDGSGNVYVTGSSTGNGSGPDYATIKYAASGLPLWTNRFNGTGNNQDAANAIAVDASGNVYVTGYSTGTNNYHTDYATIKYAANGLPLWTNIFNDVVGGTATGVALKLDQDGNVYVTGSIQLNGINDAYATLKYSPAGLALWTNVFAGVNHDQEEATALAVDANGNVFVTGVSRPGGINTGSYATIKYSTDGVSLWTNFLSLNIVTATNEFVPFAMALDGSGNVYVTGGPFLNSFPYGARRPVNYATVKYSTAGVPLWTNLFLGTAGIDGHASGIAVNANGDAYVAGIANYNGYYGDYVTIKYSGPPIPLVFGTTNGGFSPNGQFVLSLTGPSGSNAVISAGTDLQTWIPLITNQLDGGMLQFTDMLATNYPFRFYRAKLQ